MEGCDMRRLFVSIPREALINVAHMGGLRTVRGSHGSHLGPFWAVVRPLGPSWGSLGPFWDPTVFLLGGVSRGNFEAVERPLRASWVPREALLGQGEALLGPS